jgi:hypothetical protein
MIEDVSIGLPTIGTSAAKNTGTSGNTIPLLDGANTWSATQTFAAITGTTIGASGPLTITSGTLAASAPAITVTQTWNNAAVNFTAFDMNVTDTAHLDTSYLMTLRVGGSSKASVDKYGTFICGSSIFSGGSTFNTNGNGQFLAATATPAGGTQDSGILFGTTAHFGMIFGSGAPTASMAQGSLYLRSDGAPQVNLNGTTGWLPISYTGKAPTSGGSGTSSTVAATDTDYIINASGTYTLTLPAATTTNTGRLINLKSINAQIVNSASSNVVPLSGTQTAGTAIFTATAGKWATLRSDGTNWVIMQGN